MKPPFKASNSAIMCYVHCGLICAWFVASLSCINMTLKS